MRPMTEVPKQTGIQVVVYLADGRSETGWIGRIPGRGTSQLFNDDDRAFQTSKRQFDSYAAEETHGELPWGHSRHKHTDHWSHAIGWSLPEVIIVEDPL